MPANAIDLAKVADVLAYLGTTSSPASSGDGGNVQLCLTSWSFYWLRMCSMGNADGSVPTKSPFVEVVDYDECYDGQGNFRQGTRVDPIKAVSLVQVGLVAIPQSTAIGVPGWVIDGSGKFIAIRNAGGGNPGMPLTVGFASRPGGGYRFLDGIQNVRLKYSAGFAGTPFDIQEKSIKAVAINYKRKSWLDQKSQAMAGGAGTVSYNDWEISPDIRACMRNYMRKKILA